MNAIIGIIISIIGCLAFLIFITIFTDDDCKSPLTACVAMIVSVMITSYGLLVVCQYTFKCCETINFTNTCEICGYEYNLGDEWICCNEYNYGKYCTNCGKERKSEEEQYVYCCGKKYNIENDNYCSVCGEKIAKTTS